jgi:hypothetical protein
MEDSPENEIPGIILIISCNKHKETRLAKYTLSKREYNNWKVFIIIGNPFLHNTYEINENIITIKCEDSYIHLMKKVALSMKIVTQLYKIKYGILRCGDDLKFNENILDNFTKSINSSYNPNYLGKYANPNYNKQTLKKIDYFMPNYFYTHQSDVLDPLNGLQEIPISALLKLNEVPNILYTGGVIIYVSVHSCNTIINEMEKVNWNVFNYNTTFGFTYIIEDIGIAYALYNNNIFPDNYELYSDIPNANVIGFHTNEYK